MLDASPLSPDLPFGSMVRGLTLVQLADEPIRTALRQLWDERGVIVFRDGDASVEFQLRLSEVFGPLVCHQDKFQWVDGHRELVSVTADPVMDITVEHEGNIRVGALPWHSDARWLAEPPYGGLLRIRQMPREGGETGFLDMISTYQRLPVSLKHQIEGLESVVRFGADPDRVFRFQLRKPHVLNLGDGVKLMAERTDYPPIVQPLVYVQPQTGRKVLGFTPLASQQLQGLSYEESEALLDELASYATDEDHAYFHLWEDRDLVLWDNLRMLHCGFGIPPGDERVGWRTTIGGGYPVARPLEAGGFSWTLARG